MLKSVSYPPVEAERQIIGATICALTVPNFRFLMSISLLCEMLPTWAVTTSAYHERSVNIEMSVTPEKERGSADGIQASCAAWSTLSPTTVDYATVVSELNASKLVSEASVFESRPHVPITYLAYIKQITEAFPVELKSKDRCSTKKWKYVNEASVWIETGLTALEIAKTRKASPQEMALILALAETLFKAALEVRSMCSQYFRDVA